MINVCVIVINNVFANEYFMDAKVTKNKQEKKRGNQNSSRLDEAIVSKIYNFFINCYL